MIRTLATFIPAVLIGMTAALLPAVPAHADGPANADGPECTDVAISTRVCVRGPGHTAIITSPNPAFTNPYPGWGFGTLGFPVFGFGGMGIGGIGRVGGGTWTGF